MKHSAIFLLAPLSILCLGASPQPPSSHEQAVVELFDIIGVERTLIGGAFYRTPTGQKALSKLPEAMQRGAAIGAQLGEAHAAELAQMRLERKKILESEQKP